VPLLSKVEREFLLHGVKVQGGEVSALETRPGTAHRRGPARCERPVEANSRQSASLLAAVHRSVSIEVLAPFMRSRCSSVSVPSNDSP